MRSAEMALMSRRCPSQAGQETTTLVAPGCEALSLGHHHLGFYTTHQQEAVVTVVLCIDNFAELIRHGPAVRVNSRDQYFRLRVVLRS